ncbi:hypothetical protein [Synechococcus sp. UW179A]|uniref:lipase/acyltransferase domain-containing protein n=1 Tax=Synechococcus sp. UW179A TaxID=2575510 RepID=UPI000E0EC5E9|nr:hypothetical protein [Synechococcus sp. UW179A]
MDLASIKTGLLVVLVLLASCSGRQNIYSPSTGPLRKVLTQDLDFANPIIIIPGIGGSKFIDSRNGKVVWGAFGYNSYWPATEQENKLLALPLNQSAKNILLADNNITTQSVLDTVKIEFLPPPFVSIEYSVYLNIFKSLTMAGFVPVDERDHHLHMPSSKGKPVFQFAYDWRKSNASNAKRLDAYIKAISKQLTENKGLGSYPKIDIVCHSMGCLMARYYLRYGDQDLGTLDNPPVLDWRGASKIENLVMVAPPNKGSINALNYLIHGFHISPFKYFKYPSAVVGTMPSVYELLPRKDIVNAVNQDGFPVNLFDPKLWLKMQWGLVDPKQKSVLRQIAPEYHRESYRYKQAKALQQELLKKAFLFHSLIDAPATPPDGLKFWLFAGVGTPTVSKIMINTSNRTYSKLKNDAGDGSVLRESAYAIKNTELPREGSLIHWNNAMFFYLPHIELVKSNDFLVNFYYVLFWRKFIPVDR